jgi:hypothetical protein
MNLEFVDVLDRKDILREFTSTLEFAAATESALTLELTSRVATNTSLIIVLCCQSLDLLPRLSFVFNRGDFSFEYDIALNMRAVIFLFTSLFFPDS